MKKIIISLLLFGSSCALYSYRAIQIEDCVSEHLRILRREERVSSEYYEKITESCEHIYKQR